LYRRIHLAAASAAELRCIEHAEGLAIHREVLAFTLFLPGLFLWL
jgi:hypothetical protein